MNSLRSCGLCPRCCGADRLAGATGRCGAGDMLAIYGFFPHHGEEPPISGSRGSGAVFFSHCPLACIYCQNYRWSQEGEGAFYDVAGLAGIFRDLRGAACHNWNLVGPSQWIPWIIEALEIVEREGEMLPVVYNTSGYERVETLKALNGIVNIYLADIRYASNESAAASGANDYVERSREALAEMWRQVGNLRTDGEGIAVSGLICRLLVMPGLDAEARENLVWLADALGTDISLSIMSQYTPAYRAVYSPPWNRRITKTEYMSVCAEADRLGFDQGWIQEYDVASHDNALVGFNMSPGSGLKQDINRNNGVHDEWT